jgi:hypothetical protein
MTRLDMEGERSTTDLTTTNGHTVVMHDYVTGNEARAIKRVSDADGGNAEAMDKAQDHAVRLVVRLLDGSTEQIVERMGELPLADYSEIVAAVTDLLNPKKKSQPQPPTTPAET